MLHVIQVLNPFDFHYDEVIRSSHADGLSIREVTREIFGQGFVEFEYPTVCLVNSEPIPRAAWDVCLPLGATVTFVRLAQAISTIIIAVVVIAVVAIVVAVVVAKTNPAAIGAANTPGQTKNGASVYTLEGLKNQNRLNSPIEGAYGLNLMYPSYAAIPYNLYSGNEQYQYSLYCLGHGSFDITQMYFGTTPLHNFQDVEFQIVDPGGTFTLFPDDVETSINVSGIELFAPNENQFSGPTPAFAANSPFTQAFVLEVDVSLPAGLYKVNPTTGKLEDQAVQVLFWYQRISDTGGPLGDWHPLFFATRTIIATQPSNDPLNQGPGVGSQTQYTEEVVYGFLKSLHTNTPQRFTLRSGVLPGGRYQVRAQRTSNKNLDSSSGNTVKWDALRAFLPSVRNYGDVTLIGVKARATDNLNDNASQKFNVLATRKLRTWSPTTGWSAIKPTRNPVWAFCDVFTAKYGARLPDTFLDLASLYVIAQQFATEGCNFDYIFTSTATVWDTATAICKVGRGVPMLNGSRLTIIRDLFKTTPVAIFNPYNIVADSFVWEIRLTNVNDYNGIEITYTDETTWQPQVVDCLIEGDIGDNLEQITLSGCSDRTRAYREGLYMRAVEVFNREQITFKTGMEGYLPRYGDLILVQHDVPKWGFGGMVEAVDGTTLTLSDPVTFTEGVNYSIALRKKNGSVYGPVPVSIGVNSTTVSTETIIPDDFYFDSVHERPCYLIGPTGTEAKECVVVGITPDVNNTIQLTCVNYDPRVYQYDGLFPTGPGVGAKGVVDPSTPIVLNVKAVKIPGTTDFVAASWPPALGARTYIVDESADGVNWTRVATIPSTSIQVRVIGGTLWIRVAGVGVRVGPYAIWKGSVGADVPTTLGEVSGFVVSSSSAGSVTLSWNALTGADEYLIKFFQYPAGNFLRSVETDGLSTTYTLDMGAIDGLAGLKLRAFIDGENIKTRSSVARSLDFTIPGLLLPPPVIRADNITSTADTTLYKADHT